MNDLELFYFSNESVEKQGKVCANYCHSTLSLYTKCGLDKIFSLE